LKTGRRGWMKPLVSRLNGSKTSPPLATVRERDLDGNRGIPVLPRVWRII
jgi:hypothetical protein